MDWNSSVGVGFGFKAVFEVLVWKKLEVWEELFGLFSDNDWEDVDLLSMILEDVLTADVDLISVLISNLSSGFSFFSSVSGGTF